MSTLPSCLRTSSTLLCSVLVCLYASGCSEDAAPAGKSPTSTSTTTTTRDFGQPKQDLAMPDLATSVDQSSPSRLVEQAGLEGRCEDAMRQVLALEEGEEVVLKDFNVRLKEFGHVEVRSGSRVIFATAEDKALIEVAMAPLDVEEHQGSFKIKENERKVTCQRPRDVESFQSEKGSLIVRGGFADGDRACDRATFEIQLCPISDKRLGFSARVSTPEAFNQLTLRPASTKDQLVFGAGQQFMHEGLNLKGKRLPIISQEGGVGRGHPVITRAVNTASEGSGGSEESTYYAAPYYMTNDNQGLLFENTELAWFDFTKDTQHDLTLYATKVDGQILKGDTPLEMIEALTEHTGRMPEPPTWLDNGAIIALARDLDASEQIVDDLLGRGAKVGAVWNQTWSGISKTFIGEQVLWHWIQNPRAHPKWDTFVGSLEAKNVRTLCYVNSMFRELPPEEMGLRRNLYDEALKGDYFIKNESGNPYKMPVTAFDVYLLDLTNQAARTWMKSVLKEEMIDRAGCSGWMADFAEALPFDAVLSDGTPAATYHNQYPVEWMRINREAVEEAGKLGEVLIFNRSGSLKTPAYSLMLWEGDQLTTWDKYDGIQSALYGLLGGGLSGISLNHSDTGGYTSLSRWNLGYKRESELLKRWTEMNAFTAVLRTHEGNQPGINAQIYSDDAAKDHFAKFTKVYFALSKYRRTLFKEAAEKGWPVVRHMMLEFPEDEAAYQEHDQFMLGSDILVAPVVEKCGSEDNCNPDREVYLPKGRWVHIWSGRSYGNSGKGETITIKAPLGEPAVFHKRGSQAGFEFVQALESLGVKK